MHPRNRHRDGYDFAALTRSFPALSAFVRPNPFASGAETIDFSAPAAVKALNRALLKHHYGIAEWDIPPGYLCPPIPGRADYVHHLADLMGEARGRPIPRGPKIAVLDIGVGANCIYPIIGVSEYGWCFVGSDIDPEALASARAIVAANPSLRDRIECRLQAKRTALLEGVVKLGDHFDAVMCNPPFHGSAAEAAAGTRRKIRNLSGNDRASAVLNFGGQNHELWCDGGELRFVRRLIAESARHRDVCRWFTTLVSKRENLPAIEGALRAVRPSAMRTIGMAHGQKKSRIVAWTFQ